MGKLSAASVFISGLNGLGVEIAKNVVLANVRRVTLHDSKATAVRDLGAQFYLSEGAVGTNRAEASRAHLQELNSNVIVDVASGVLSAEMLEGYSVVVCIDTPHAKLVEIGEFCHKRGIAFITGDVNGLVGRAFVDVGNDFVVQDPTGEALLTGVISKIEGGNPAKVTCVSDERLELQSGDKVVFSEVEGMVELNDGVPRTVGSVTASSFTIEGTEGYGAYVRGGLWKEVRQPKVLQHRTYAAACADPGMFLESDFSKFGRSGLLHLMALASADFFEAHGRAPSERGDADEVLAGMRAQNEKQASKTEIDSAGEDVVRKLLRGCHAVLNPMCAIFGGLMGQEVIKAITGKFHPLDQWLYMDFVEALPEKESDPSDYAPRGSRYDDQIAVFGHEFQEKLGALKYFLVGAGALGCEFIKNFAMMGVACGPTGLVTVTDDDTIERSNLTRQFLFRNHMIGQSKSAAAANVAVHMNKDFHIRPFQDRVSPQTESFFNDEFWGSLDGVCNALDNVKARLYVDSRCLFFNKPLLESGTLGPKCNTQIVVPHISENYGASQDPAEKQIPDCTLHNFPSTINHCISWGKSEFIGCFEVSPFETKRFLESASLDAYKQTVRQGLTPQELREKLLLVKEAVLGEQCVSFEDCIRWARLRFQEYFFNRIVQLTFSFPRDAKTRNGLPFWSPPKRFPNPINFDSKNPLHLAFVIAGANLRAKTLCIPVPESQSRNAEFIGRVAAGVSVPPFAPSASTKIKTDEDQGQGNDADLGNVEDEIEKIFAELGQPSNYKLSLSPEEFEKDVDTNFHIDFISATGNLRGNNYEIESIDKFQAKLIAGNIIPAIATTTAMATGFVCVELYKLIQKKPLESYRNTFANLALPLFAMSEPMPPKKIVSRTEKNIPDPINHPEYVEEREVVAYPNPHTAWDRIDVREGDITLGDFIKFFQEKHGLTLTMMAIQAGAKGLIVYNSMMPKFKESLPQTLSALLASITGEPLGSRTYLLPQCVFSTKSGDDVDVPPIVFHFR
eukprot:TRINITY_DN1309_c0_g1_i1.p1 TRINITY_DN1309_c0_g1~~TRINITY_DN1309_c0_g1_i1.p1  ORF type:complete len:1097 (-),score=298.82 TRINITY_DN1309_c0_g1_i1:48-3098(-)